jgi:long-chain fatty acid transport protein
LTWQQEEEVLHPRTGYNPLLNPKLAVGVSMYGNGGMDTAYTTAIPLLGSRPLGVDSVQLFVAP